MTTLLPIFPRPVAATFAFAVCATLAHAHPGHGLRGATATHILTSPYHLLMLAGSGAVLFLVARRVRHSLLRRLLQGSGFAALAGAAVIWGLRA